MTLYYFNSSGRMHQDKVLLVHNEGRVELLEGDYYSEYYDFDDEEFYSQDLYWIVIHTNR